MKNKSIIKIAITLCICFALILTPIIAFAAVSPDVSEREDIIINEDVSQRLSRYNFQQICNEINSISKKGVELPDLLFHSAALAERINSVSEDELFEIIKNKQNSENLRIICIQLLDFADIELNSNDFSQLETIVLDEKESSLVRQNAVWILSSSAQHCDTLEKVVFQDDEQLAFQALKKLNVVSPQRARSIANTLIQNEENGEKLRIAVKVISSQLAQSDDVREKDLWVEYCMDIFSKTNMSKTDLMGETIVFALSDMHYSEAIYKIIEDDRIDKSYKVFCIGENAQVLTDALKNNPTNEEIEIAIKAMTIYPIDKTVEALKEAAANSSTVYDLSNITSQKAEKFLEKHSDV